MNNSNYGSILDVLREFGTARRPHWYQGTYVFFKRDTLKIKFGNTGVTRDFIPNKADIMSTDWVPFVEKKEKCTTCIRIEKLNLDFIENPWKSDQSKRYASIMIDHLVEFHPCTCKK